MKTALLTAAALLGILLLATGCEEENSLQATTQQLIESQQRVSVLEREVFDLQQETAAQDRQIATLMEMGDRNPDLLYTVHEIRLGNYSGGWDLSGDGLEDGVKLFLTPHDQDGTLCKSAGAVTARLYDLSAGEQSLIGEYTWTVEELAGTWTSGFMGSYFGLDCPWPAGSPEADEITAHVTFTDYLTGRTFSVQRVCEIHRTPSATEQTDTTEGESSDVENITDE
jgi:hypothetical protein